MDNGDGKPFWVTNHRATLTPAAQPRKQTFQIISEVNATNKLQMKMSKIAMAQLTALVAVSSLVLWSCASKPPPSDETHPSGSDIEKALVTKLPTFTRVSSLSVVSILSAETKQNLGTNVVWQARIKATITVTTDTFTLESENSDENSEVTFVQPVKRSGESIEVFGKCVSELYAGAWRTTVELEGQPIETLGQPLTAFGPKKVIVRGSEDEKQYFADGDVPATGEADIAEVKSIDDYCKTVDAVSQGRESPDMIFADLSGHAGEKREKWSRFASEKALEKARRKFEKTGGWYKIAYIYKNRDRIVGANVMFSSSSGDWVKDVYQYFREDGSLAYVMSHFGTFYDEYKFEQRKYFDRNGRLISKSEKYFDLTTDEPIKKVKSEEHAGLRDRIDYYMTVSKLPFAHLLSLKAK